MSSLHALNLPLLHRDNPAIATYRNDTMMAGDPDAVLRARDLQDIEEALRFCRREKIPVTFCGSQTSMTGASVATEGLLITTDAFNRVLDVGEGTCVTQPGVILSDLKKTVAAEGWFYPPAPTSQDDARVGATVSTNATGEDSLQYGTTRRYVREMKVLLADGSRKTFSRGTEKHTDELNKAGYFLSSNNPLHYFIGGEGTLGFIYEITLDLIRPPGGFFSALAPFPSSQAVVDFTVNVLTQGKFHPRAMEMIDENALHYMKTHPTFPKNLREAKALLYFKQEYIKESECDSYLSEWFSAGLTEDTLVAFNEKQKEEIRLWRHHIPLKLNEEYQHYWKTGGGKVGSDWWVPIPRLREMIRFVYETGNALGIPFMVYAHLGQGHPHVNYLCKTPQEKAKAKQVLWQCCRKAVELGGGVTGEHGIGKLHHNLLPIQWNQERIEQMVRIKKEFDPDWILGRGNILTPPLK
ncbi:MAG: FAD-binding oxidoreductase [Deltaproteobacteria bacterium]|nr:FAD-binding oxidoreductase [Deltaproteobacteria bacterium]